MRTAQDIIDNANLTEIVEQLQSCGYECEDGVLTKNIYFEALVERAETERRIRDLLLHEGEFAEFECVESVPWVSSTVILRLAELIQDHIGATDQFISLLDEYGFGIKDGRVVSLHKEDTPSEVTGDAAQEN